jgi:hypothetical protein
MQTAGLEEVSVNVWAGTDEEESAWLEKVAVDALVAQCRGSARCMLTGIANFHGARAGRPLVRLRQIIKTVDP